MLFKDRFDAALKLIPCIRNYKNEISNIYAIPGGGVPIGYYLSKDYDIPMELLLSKKINHPKSGLAIGSVTMNDFIIEKNASVTSGFIKDEVAKIRKEMKLRYEQFTDNRKPLDVKRKMVLIVDDGAATGQTLLSAIRLIREKKPSKIVIALPVAPAETLAMLSKEVDAIVCLRTIPTVVSVGFNYLNYSKVTDREIFQLLNSANRLDIAA